MKRMLSLLVLPGLLLCPVSARADAAVDRLVAGALAAYGGEKIEAVRAYRMTGTVEARMQGTEAPFERLFARPGRLAVELAYPDKQENRYLDGGRGWRTSPRGGGIEAVEGFLLKSMLLQAARANIPWILAERRNEFVSIPPREVKGEMAEGLEIVLDEGLALRLYLQPGTFRVVLSQGILKAKGMDTHFETFYSDFREAGGVLFPYREENWASGFNTGSTVVDRVEVNPQVGDGDFRPE